MRKYLPTMSHRPAASCEPRRVQCDNGPWPLHSAAASRVVESAALASAAPQSLMQRAGLAVARLALATAPHAQRVAVLAGPGNNGGDGLVAALHLHRAGREVRVHLLADLTRLPADAADALQCALAGGVLVSSGPLVLDGADLVIDALLGLGARPLQPGAIADAVAHINASRSPVLAVDLPSGLNPDTGQPNGQAAVRATATLSLLTLKPGLFTGAGRDHAGVVWFDGLGIAPLSTHITAFLITAADAQAVLQSRPHTSHKGSFGDLAVVGGAPGMTGAAWLAARSALPAGAGRVYVSLLDEHAAMLDPLRPELMLRNAWWRAPPAVLLAATVVAGCGGGTDIAAALPALLSQAGRLVLDADALNALAADPALLALLTARAARGRPTVLTPHPLEAARLLGCSAMEVQHDRLTAAQALADRHRCVVVLKGSGTVVADAGALPCVNPTGNALLASAGTGDVLAGWIGGLWAAGQPSITSAQAACAAVWLLGRAADRQAARRGGALPLRAADLIDAMRDAIHDAIHDAMHDAAQF